MAEIQQQLPHSAQHMNTGNVIQIEVPDFDLNIDEVLPIPADQNTDYKEIQGSVNSTQQFPKKQPPQEPLLHHNKMPQDVDRLDMIPVEIPPQPDQEFEQNIPTLPTLCDTDRIEILQLETDSEEEEEEQFQDLQMYLTHHNTYEESQNICKEYRARLLELDNDRYYEEVDRAYQTYSSLPAQDYIPTNQAPGSHHMTQELMQIFGKGGGQVHREELHGH